jgi:ankyrin repeat protein
LTISAGQIDNFYFLINDLAVRYTIKDDEDNTSLLLAVKINKGDLVKAILEKMEKDQIMTPLEKQFFFNAQNKEGNTALH